jgi:hypothetical protein
MDFASAFDSLSNQEFAVHTAALAGGFVSPNVLRTGVENYAGMDLPDEAYGAATGAAFYISDMKVMAAGSAVNVADRVLNRYGIAVLGGDF